MHESLRVVDERDGAFEDRVVAGERPGRGVGDERLELLEGASERVELVCEARLEHLHELRRCDGGVPLGLRGDGPDRAAGGQPFEDAVDGRAGNACARRQLVAGGGVALEERYVRPPLGQGEALTRQRAHDLVFDLAHRDSRWRCVLLTLRRFTDMSSNSFMSYVKP